MLSRTTLGLILNVAAFHAEAASPALPELLITTALRCSARRLEPGEADRLASRLHESLPDRSAAKLLLAAYQDVRARFTDRDPYADLLRVLEAAVIGQPLPVGSTGAQRELHEALIAFYAPAAAQARWKLSSDAVETRYPRLLRAMRDAAILSYGEAQSALYALLRRHPSQRETLPPTSEAVAHFGGNLAVVRAAIRRRKLFPATRRVVRGVKCSVQARTSACAGVAEGA